MVMTGVRRILNHAAHRALATRHAEAWYVATVLANSTTAGSYRSALGLGTDPAGLASLRAWRSQTNANIVTAASLKGLADLLISLVQLDIVQARETRRLARQVLRLTRVQTGDLSSADVGDDTA